MTKHRSKVELLNDICMERNRLEEVLRTLTHKEMNLTGVVGNWSSKDVLAHLTAWEQLFIRWYEAGINGKPVKPTPVGMSRRAIDIINEQIYQRHRRQSLKKTLTEFHKSYQTTLSTIQGIPEKDMFVESRYPWTGRLKIADYIAGNTCNHYRWAASQIKRWENKKLMTLIKNKS